jgi:hypothetical protein
MIQLDLLQIISIIITISSFSIGLAKYVLSQIDNRFQQMDETNKEDGKQWVRIDRELLELWATLPQDYQQRDDAIRNQSIIEAK